MACLLMRSVGVDEMGLRAQVVEGDVASDVSVPNYPPTRLVIDVPLDGEPSVVEDGGLADYLLEAVFTRLAQDRSTYWEVNAEEES